MDNFPPSHIADAHSLVGDGRVMLFELTPTGGSGTIRFKKGASATWQGNTYESLPVDLSDEKYSVENGSPQPNLTIGAPDSNLSVFKSFIHNGFLDGAIVTRRVVLYDNLVNNRPISELATYRVKRLESYSRSQIVMQLGPFSDSLNFSIPSRLYLPPDFKSVLL